MSQLCNDRGPRPSTHDDVAMSVVVADSAEQSQNNDNGNATESKKTTGTDGRSASRDLCN